MRRTTSIAFVVATSCVGRVEDAPTPPLTPTVPTKPNTPTTPINPNNPIDPVNCVETAPPVTARVRRLTFAQYDRTVSELLGVEVTPSTGLGPEIEGVTPTLWAGVEAAAAELVAQLDANALGALVSCTPSGDGAACAHTFVVEVGQRAYRRPLTSTEIARYDALYTDRAQLTETGTFEEGVGLILEAMLMSPSFLARVEASAMAQDGMIKLAGYEVATRLSYALWNGPPDDALLAAAAAGTLDTALGVRTQAERMLTNEGVPRARSMFRDAQRDYLGMVGAYGAFWSNTLRDTTLFPEFYPGIDADFREEVLRFTDEVVFTENGGFGALLTSQTGVINERLAPIYGLTGSFGPAWQTVTLPPDRPGLLTRAGFVGTHGRVGRGSLIFRGAFVLKRVLCQEIGSPPAGADATPLPDPGPDVNTTRERIQAMTANEPCRTCHHTRINPAGFALESFDGIGKTRTMDNGEAVDTTGTIRIDGQDVSYTDAATFSAVLGASGQGRACFVQRFADFTFSSPGVTLGCNRDRIAARLGEPGVTIKDMMVDLVTSDAFRHRSTEEAP